MQKQKQNVAHFRCNVSTDLRMSHLTNVVNLSKTLVTFCKTVFSFFTGIFKKLFIIKNIFIWSLRSTLLKAEIPNLLHTNHNFVLFINELRDFK